MAESSFGRYQLQGLLGRGGMGQVFRAYDTATHRVVAIKLLPPHLAEDREFELRFRREARTAAGLTDPHIVPIHSFGEIDGQLYVDMRLIEGRDLAHYITEHGGRLSPSRTVKVIEQVAAALDSAHQAGLVHRDVKPSNILLAKARDFVYLIDFGIARATTDTALTNTGHTMGTLAYLAPERFRGTTDPRADVYSLACVLYECLTGTRPFPGESYEEQIKGHLYSPPPRPTAIVGNLPPAFDAVVAHGLAKDPETRYQSVLELADAARAALGGVAGTAPHRPPLAEAPTERAPLDPQPAANLTAKTGSRIALVATVAGSGLALILVAALVTFFVGGDNTATSASSSNATTHSKVPDKAEASETADTTGATGSVPALPAFSAPANFGANCQYPASPDHPASRPVNPPQSGKVSTASAGVAATMVTNEGNIGLRLATGKSPCTVNSFVSLAQQGFFDNTRCHWLSRSQKLSALQCGDPKADGTGGPGYDFDDEYPTNQYQTNDPKLRQPVVYPRGTIAMTTDTNGSQFYLVYDDSELPPVYTVFGTIDERGLTVLEKVAKAGVVGGGDDGTPVTTLTIKLVLLD